MKNKVTDQSRISRIWLQKRSKYLYLRNIIIHCIQYYTGLYRVSGLTSSVNFLLSNTVYPNSLKQFLVLAKSQALLGTFKDFIITKAEPCSNYFLELLKFTEHKYISKGKGN